MTIAWKEQTHRHQCDQGHAQVEALRVIAETLVQLTGELTVIREHFVNIAERLEADDAREESGGRSRAY